MLRQFGSTESAQMRRGGCFRGNGAMANKTGTHVIVVGNEKGGSGKSTTAFHLAIYLMYQGYRVASIDVDSRQQTLTQYVRNRGWSSTCSGRRSSRLRATPIS
jgi:Mrp family chromosome partitioning ATPase